MITDINNEDRLVQATFADHLRDVLGWENVFAHNEETFGPAGTLGRASEREAVLVRDLRAAVQRPNPDLPEAFASRPTSVKGRAARRREPALAARGACGLAPGEPPSATGGAISDPRRPGRAARCRSR